jgi:hypothetical protein
MRYVSLSLAVLVLSLASWAQAASPQDPPQMNQGPPPNAPMHHQGMQGMGPDHMAQMKAQVDQMSAAVAEMKDNTAKIKDPAAKKQAQMDAQLWDSMVKHMEGMVKMMSDHQQPGTMGMGMMDHDGMAGMAGGGCCAGMKDGAMQGGGCCGAGKCMKPNAPAAPAPPSAPSE